MTDHAEEEMNQEGGLGTRREWTAALQNRTAEVIIMNPRVQSVTPEDEYQLRLTFTNGEVRIYDCSHLLNFGVFKELRQVEYFRQVRAALGTVVWPNEQDICPDTLYEDSREPEDASNSGIQMTARS